MGKDRALEVVEINCNPDCKYSERKWQGIPGIERRRNGRLFVTFYTGD